MSFSFGTPKTATGFTLPTTSAPASTAPTFQFSSGAGDTSASLTPQSKPGLGLFGTPASGSFSLSSTLLKPSAATGTPISTLGTLNFGTPATTGAALSIGTPATTGIALNYSTPTTTSAPLSFGTPIASSGTLSFGTPSTTGATLSFGTPAATTSTGFTLGTPASSSAPQFNLGGSSATTTTSATSVGTSLSFGTPASTTPASTGLSFSLGTAATSTATSTVAASATTTSLPSFGFTTATTSAPTFSLGSTATIAATSIATSSATIQSSVLPPTGTLTFAQLEDAINKWTIDLEDQTKIFINQAKQLNAWDRLLISNGEKILTLNSGIERVKQQQQQLDQELDFVLSQQKELEDLIVPLEKELAEVPVHDQDRHDIYQMAEGLDSQLKQMSDDLKEVIDHLNEATKSQELQDPITQIARILNAHMNSLQWIDRNTTQISAHLDQLAKMTDLNHRNHSFNI